VTKRTQKVAGDLKEYLSDVNTRLPRRLPLKEMAILVHDAHVRDGGASIHPRFGNLKRQALIAVSLYPERTLRINGSEIPFELIAVFYKQNADLFQDPRLILGTWYNADQDITYLDVTAVFPRWQEAVSLAATYNQIAVYDLALETEVSIGGTGDEPSDMPPEIQRLPPLMRMQEEE